MPYVHEFGIVACIEKDKEYIHYEPEKYDCIIVDGDLRLSNSSYSPYNFCPV